MATDPLRRLFGLAAGGWRPGRRSHDRHWAPHRRATVTRRRSTSGDGDELSAIGLCYAPAPTLPRAGAVRSQTNCTAPPALHVLVNSRAYVGALLDEYFDALRDRPSTSTCAVFN
jgi:hypothetical protein